MTTEQKITAVASVAVTVAILAWDWCMYRSGWPTISEVVRHLGERWGFVPYLLALLLGMLVQHFFRHEPARWYPVAVVFVVGMVVARTLRI